MIRFALPVNPETDSPLDLICPVFACDVCGEVITDGQGLILYRRSKEMLHVHSGRCDRRVKRDREWAWRPLDEFVAQLQMNHASAIPGSTVTIETTGDVFTAGRLVWLDDLMSKHWDKEDRRIRRDTAKAEAADEPDIAPTPTSEDPAITRRGQGGTDGE